MTSQTMPQWIVGYLVSTDTYSDWLNDHKRRVLNSGNIDLPPARKTVPDLETIMLSRLGWALPAALMTVSAFMALPNKIWVMLILGTIGVLFALNDVLSSRARRRQFRFEEAWYLDNKGSLTPVFYRDSYLPSGWVSAVDELQRRCDTAPHTPEIISKAHDTKRLLGEWLALPRPTKFGVEACESGVDDPAVQAVAKEHRALIGRIERCEVQVTGLISEIDKEILIHRARQLQLNAQPE